MKISELHLIAMEIADYGNRIKHCERLFTEHIQSFYAASRKNDQLTAAKERDNVHTILDSQMDALVSIQRLKKKVSDAG